MAFVHDHVRAIDGQLERLQLASLHQTSKPELNALDSTSSSRTDHLRSLIKSLSLSRRGKHNAHNILQTLRQSRSSDDSNHLGATQQGGLDQELQWILVGKAAVQTYGLLLDALIQQTLPINDEIWYWQDVLGSYRYSALFSIQTSPIRFWSWSKQIYSEVRQRKNVVVEGWRDFYRLVQTVVQEKSVADLQRRAASPFAIMHADLRKKLSSLEDSKSLNASGVGYLLSNCFDSESLQAMTSEIDMTSTDDGNHDLWKASVVKSISVMDSVLRSALETSSPGDSFDESVAEFLNDDDLSDCHRPYLSNSSSAPAQPMSLEPAEASMRLEQILESRLDQFSRISNETIKMHSRPSRFVRYWLPAAALLLSSSTILRILVNRKAEILQWIREVGATTIDFWQNWVVEPTKKLIGTIRHDEASEVSIMSKSSLEGDRSSLERMVVDFAVDNPEGSALSDAQIADVRGKIQQGDLTPVLKAYEKDLKKPFTGAVRGNLIRALLIQIQKTKVDVEVAMGGIDSLLKSQELVFGFVGLTPGILVCIGAYRWLGSLFVNKKDQRNGRTQSKSFQILRNIDRILTGSPQANDGMLSSREYGLLVCEAVILRDVASRKFSKEALREFLQDFDDLIDNSSGVGRQIRVADRIRWAYASWL